MSGFRYTPYDSPYAGTIGSLIAHGADAHARAAEIGGQAWGGAVANIGQSIAAIPPQIQQQRLVEQRQQAGALDLETKQRGAAATKFLSTAMQETPQLSEDGVSVWDVPAITKKMAAGGYGAEAGAAAQHLDGINTAFRQAQAARQAVVQKGAQAVAASGNDPTLAGHFLDQLEANALAPKETVQQYREFLKADPANTAKLTAYLMGPQKMERGAPGSVAVNPITGLPVPRSEVPEKKTPYTINGQRFDGDGTPLGPVVPPQTVKSIESKHVLLDGKPAIVNFNPATGTHTLPDGTDVSTRVKPIPAASIQINAAKNAAPAGDFAKTGDDFLQTIPVQWRRTVEKIARYDEDPTKVASMRGDKRETLMQWVNQVNPAYKQDEFSNRAPTRKAFTTGTQGQTINAINTAIGHLDQLTGLVDQLGNGAFVPGNRVWNNLATMFGSDKVTNFDTLKDALAGEVAKALNGGVATVSGIAAEKDKMNAYSSPLALAGYVKTLVPTMGSKLTNLDYQYHQAMGETDPFSALSPTSKAILTKFGFDPAHPEIGSGGDPDLAGLATGHARTFKDGPHKGETWTVGPDGHPRKVS